MTDTQSPLLGLEWLWCSCGLAIEDVRHLLETVTSSLWVEEVDSEIHDQKNNDEDNVVLPRDCLQGDRVDESVEEDGKDSNEPCDGDTAGSERVRPDFDGVRDEERCDYLLC